MPDGYLFLSISVDALEWTNHWLGRRRCDLLSIFLAERADLSPQVRIVAVESKGRTDRDVIEVKVTASPFDEASEQVVATLDALDSVLCPDAAASVFADLKLSAFVEHLTSETLARLSPILANETHKLHVLTVLSNLSRRNLTCEQDIQLEGLAVLTQRNATVATVVKVVSLTGTRRTWPVRLARCGVPLIRELLEESVQSADEKVHPEPTESTVEPPNEIPAVTPSTRPIDVIEGSETASGEALDEESLALLVQLEAACKLRGFQVGEVRPENATRGPTLVSVSVELAAGEALRPIENASADIARELGVKSLSVENDPDRPYHIRFLLPRVERQFPSIPADTPLFVEDVKEHYFGLWIGAHVNGRPHRSFVSEWPHLLVAGTTGSGKTTFIKSILQQLDGLPIGDLQLIVVDGKGEYDYVDLVQPQHFAAEFPDVLLGYEHAVEVLQWLVETEVVRRREVLRKYFAENKGAPKAPRQAFVKARASGAPFPLSPVVVVIDEFAEIMLAAGQSARAFEDLVQRVVQAGRSALVHLILATQRPDANVLAGAIKANMPSRVALSLPSHHDSMTVLNSPGAEELLGSGDLFFQSSTGERLRLQGYRPS